MAEYQPQTGKDYYYTTDQIGSTRIVTDDTGNIVYAAAHDPYGGVQQTWVNVFNPELKFSGKEQDAESALYYFGARYYDPALYRFLSPDPVIPTERALYNHQSWNLYGYCRNNPISFADPDGRETINIFILRFYYGTNSTQGLIFVDGEYIGVTLENSWRGAGVSRSCIPEGIYSCVAEYHMDRYGNNWFVLKTDYSVWDEEINNYVFAGILFGGGLGNVHNCILIGDDFIDEKHIRGINAHKRLERIYYEEMKKSIELASYATGTDMVIYSFDALDYLSEAFHVQEVQINLMVTSVSTLMLVVGQALALFL